MVELNQNGWHDVVRGYLRALFDDTRAELESLLSSSQAEFLCKFGTATVQGSYNRAAKARLDSLSPPPDESCWRIVEDAESQLLVEVTIDPDNRPRGQGQ